MKKFLLIGLCVIVGLFSFVACGENSNSDEYNNDPGWTSGFY